MKKYFYKIKDLPKDFNLVGCKIYGVEIVSGWNKGFWMKGDNGQDSLKPLFFKDFAEIKDWKIEVPLERALQIELSKQ